MHDRSHDAGAVTLPRTHNITATHLVRACRLCPALPSYRIHPLCATDATRNTHDARAPSTVPQTTVISPRSQSACSHTPPATCPSTFPPHYARGPTTASSCRQYCKAVTRTVRIAAPLAGCLAQAGETRTPADHTSWTPRSGRSAVSARANAHHGIPATCRRSPPRSSRPSRDQGPRARAPGAQHNIAGPGERDGGRDTTRTTIQRKASRKPQSNESLTMRLLPSSAFNTAPVCFRSHDCRLDISPRRGLVSHRLPRR